MTILIAVEGVSPKVDLNFLVNGGTKASAPGLAKDCEVSCWREGSVSGCPPSTCLKWQSQLWCSAPPSVVPMSTQTSQILSGLWISFIFMSIQALAVSQGRSCS